MSITDAKHTVRHVSKIVCSSEGCKLVGKVKGGISMGHVAAVGRFVIHCCTHEERTSILLCPSLWYLVGRVPYVRPAPLWKFHVLPEENDNNTIYTCNYFHPTIVL